MLKKINFDRPLILLFVLIFLVLSSNLLVVFYYRQHRMEIENSYIHELHNDYSITMDVYSNMADFVFNLYVDNERVKNIFAKGVHAGTINEKKRYRKLLLRELSSLYTKINKYNFRQLHFHEKNNRSFLRFHRPGKYGDDLTKIRYSVAYTNREKKYTSGFEEGRIFNGYRFIYPLALHNQHIGSVEISVSMQTIIRQLNERFGTEAQFIIKKEVVRRKVFEAELSNYRPWFIDDNYVLDRIVSTHSILKNRITDRGKDLIRRSLVANGKSGRAFCCEIQIDDAPGVLVFLPIKNFLGNNVAYIFEIGDNERLREQEKAFYFTMSTLFVLLVLLIAFSIYYRSSHDKIQRMAKYDSLTGLYSRGVFLKILESEFERYKRYRKSFSIIMVDVDHFKSINDTYGHRTGDIVLSGIAELMQKNMRKTDHVGRYGGEEFLVLLPETGKDQAFQAAENMRRVIAENEFHSIGTVTISCGVAEISDAIDTVDELINEADEKMYRAKRDGRNRVVM